MKHEKTAWVTSSTKNKKDWGEEISWPSILGVHGKILYIKSGHGTCLKYNPRKNESFYILSGEVIVRYGSEQNVLHNDYNKLIEERLNLGDCLNVQSGCPYKIIALTDAEVIEIGDQFSDTPIRIEADEEL
jgi:mannose-6-phosphate isomerase-like protein (cupin superfamily)